LWEGKKKAQEGNLAFVASAGEFLEISRREGKVECIGGGLNQSFTAGARIN